MVEPALLQQGRGVAAPEGTLVIITLVGGIDGLSVLVPHADRAYAGRRPGLAVEPPGERYGAIDLGRGLGLHPALAPLWRAVGRADRLAVIGGVGVPDSHGGDGRHLPSREFVHRGGRHLSQGWATRLLRFEGMGSEAVWSFGAGSHPIFDGLDDGVAGPEPAVVGGAQRVGAGRSTPAITDAWRPRSSRSETVRWSDTPWPSAADRLARGYPEGRLGRSLATTVDMLRAGAGVRIVAIDHAGYDTHVDQGDGRSGVLTHRLDRLARSLAAFWADVVDWRRPSG